MIGKTLDEGSTFERVGSRQLAGLLIAAWSVFYTQKIFCVLLCIFQCLRFRDRVSYLHSVKEKVEVFPCLIRSFITPSLQLIKNSMLNELSCSVKSSGNFSFCYILNKNNSETRVGHLHWLLYIYIYMCVYFLFNWLCIYSL